MSSFPTTFAEDVLAMRNVCPSSWLTQNLHICAWAVMLAGPIMGTLLSVRSRRSGDWVPAWTQEC
jgi:hypothetical protein